MHIARVVAVVVLLGAQARAEVTEAAALVLGKELEAAVEAGSGPSALQAAFDLDALVDRAQRGVTATPEQLAKFRRSVVAPGGLGLAPALLGRKNSFHLVTFAAAEPRLVFRRVEPDTFALSYVELLLSESPKGLRVVDATLVGELISEKLRNQLLGLVGGRGLSAAYLKVKAAWDARKVPETLAALAELPKDEAGRQDMLIVRLNALASSTPVDVEAYRQAAARLVEAYPSSQAARLAEVEVHLVLGDRARALAGLDALAALIDDPFLDFKRALIHQLSGDEAAARAAMKRALDRDPRLRLEPPDAGPVKDPLDAAIVYLGAFTGATSPEALDRIYDWPAVHAELSAKREDVKAMSVAQFRASFLESLRGRPAQADAAALERLRPQLKVERTGDRAVVTGPGLKAPLPFHLVDGAWRFRGVS